jgi:hypothetical protein
MADEPISKPTGSTAIPRIRDPQFREVYANASFTGLTPFDVTLIFSRASDLAGQSVQVDQVAVTLSPQHFKGFCRSINETLKAYEKVFGVLQIPDSDIRPLTEAPQIEKMILNTRQKVEEARRLMTLSSTEKKQPSRQSRRAARESS